MHERSHGKVALVLCLFGLSQSGCDIVQGFRDASSAIFPDEKTYFDAPGYRLVNGGYRQLELASGSSLYLLARPADPESSALYVMRYDDPKPCILPEIKAHTNGVGVFTAATTIAYTEEGTQQGTLHFVDGNCKTFDLTISQSMLPLVETAEGFLTYEGANLIIANPVTGAKRLVAVDATYLGSFSAFYILSSKDGRIGAFKPDWKEVGWFGDHVSYAGAAGGTYFYEDNGGIHRLAATSYESVSDTVVAANGCHLGFPHGIGATENWVGYYAPCDAKKFIVFAESTAHVSELGFDANPRLIAFLPTYPNQSGDPATDPFLTFYLEDGDDQTQIGRLIMRTPDRPRSVLGENVAFDRLSVFQSAAETHGFALTDVNGDVGKFVRWELDGSTQTVAEGVVRSNGDLVTNFNGDSGTGQFALLSSAGLSVVSHRVPAHGFKNRDSKNRWTAIIDDFQDSIGTLSITESSLDFAEAARNPVAPPKLEVIARDVLWDGRAQFVPALPGIAYFTQYDAKSDLGRLDYRNLELKFTATVSEGVAHYIATPGGLIYSVPLGDRAGIWVVRSR